MTAAIRATGLRHRFGDTTALDGVDLAVEQGGVLALLGPNGAGKTTTVRVLTTQLRADAGTAAVLGVDVHTDPTRVRTLIGMAGQYAAVDERLTGRENLELVGRLGQLARHDARRRASELLDRFDLVHAADRPLATYSGGMRRRVDLAAALVGRPPVLFLDEPTTGLDPRSRSDLWRVIEDLVADGTTLLLTTQYLEEADALADRIAVVDGGRIVAEGTAADLKRRAGEDVLVLGLADPGAAGRARDAVTRLLPGTDAIAVGDLVEVRTTDLAATLPAVVAAATGAGGALRDVDVRRPTLDDVFLQLTDRDRQDATTSAGAHPSVDDRALATTR